MRRLLYGVLDACGAIAVMRFLHRNSVTILLYHGVAPQGDASESSIYNYRDKFIEPAAFDWQIAYFKKHYSILELDEAVRLLRENRLPKNPLVITFDDGYRNFYTHAFPVLKKHGVPATMFLATDFVFGKKPLWVDRLEYVMDHVAESRQERIMHDNTLRSELKKLPASERNARIESMELETKVIFNNFEADRAVYAPLSSTEIRELEEAGMRFGAHTLSHPLLSREETAHGRDEIRASVELVAKEVSKPSLVFAYPNGQPGDWTEANEAAAKSAGCTGALTTIEGVNSRQTHPYRLMRMTMDATDETPAFAGIASGVRLYMSKIKQLIYANRS